MKNQKFLTITLVTALIVAGTVLVGVPAYKGLADTADCLFGPDHIDNIFVCQCLHKFTVWHRGTEGEEVCNCAHTTDGVTLWIYDGSTWRDIPMNQVKDDPCDGVDKTKWCVLVHLPSGDYSFKFKCSVGEEKTTDDMNNALTFSETDEECENFGWYSEACQLE